MRFLISLAEQGMGSIITFGINLWLIRNGRADSYGVYVFWFAIAWVMGTCQNALTIFHLSSLPSGPERLAERREPESVLFTATLALLLAVAIGVCATDLVMRSAASDLREWAAAFFIPAFLFYQFVRAFAFSRRRVVLGAALTGSVLASATAGLALDSWAGFAPDAARVMLIVGSAYGGCAVAVLFLLDPSIRPMLRRAGLRRYGDYLRGSGWMILGAGSAEITNRLYSFMVVGLFGAAALAHLSAVQVVVRPAWMLSSAWMSIGFPAMATQRACGDLRGLTGTMLRGGAVAALGAAVWSGLVILAWPWISGALYRGRYPDLGDLGLLWGANVVLGSIAVALNTGMLVLGQFRRLALIDLGGAIFCTGSILLLLQYFDYPASIVGTLTGQSAQIVLMAAALMRTLAPEWRGATARRAPVPASRPANGP